GRRGGPGDKVQPHPAASEVEAVILDVIPQGLYNDPHREHRDTTIAQAIGVRRFTLIDGIPLSDLDLFDRVTLAREITKTIIVPGQGRGIKRLIVMLGCLPGADGNIYCTPLKRLEEDAYNVLIDTITSETPRVKIVEKDEMMKIAKLKNMPEKILVVPRTPIEYDNLTNLAKTNILEAIKRIIMSNEEFFVEFFNIAGLISIRQHALELLKGVGKRTVKLAIRQRERAPFRSFEDVKKVLKIDPVEALAEKILEEIKGEAKYYLFIQPRDPSSPYFDYISTIIKEKKQK
ncbi:MAG: DUF655 domain-containing protein, partial [Desulfurococcales archaeon]|nr:DUF655 domain-containing protein [Desulfurococcales archaeon]